MGRCGRPRTAAPTDWPLEAPQSSPMPSSTSFFVTTDDGVRLAGSLHARAPRLLRPLLSLRWFIRRSRDV